MLTACGIETNSLPLYVVWPKPVATVLTACGIETSSWLLNLIGFNLCCNSAYRLRYWNKKEFFRINQRIHYRLQQCLPLAVLKPFEFGPCHIRLTGVATVLTACGIETMNQRRVGELWSISCNSAYRLRYWNKLYRLQRVLYPTRLQQCLPLAVLKQHHLLTWTLNYLSCNSAYRLRYWNPTKRATECGRATA